MCKHYPPQVIYSGYCFVQKIYAKLDITAADFRCKSGFDTRWSGRVQAQIQGKGVPGVPPPPSKISEDYRVLGYICICEQKDKYLRQFLSQLFTCLSLAILFLSYADSAR